MKHQSVYIFKLLLGSIIIFFISCTADITLNTDNSKPVIVIYGTITDQLSYQEIRISSSSGYFDNNKNDLISDAIVTISTGEGKVYDLIEDTSKPGIYKTKEKMAGLPQESYHLKVVVDFNRDGKTETYEADATMPNKAAIESIDVSKENILGHNYYSFNLYGQEPPEENYYICKYQINDNIYNQISKYSIFNDLSINDQYINGLSIEMFPNASDKDDYKNQDDFNTMIFVSQGDVIKLYISNVSKDYYKFLLQCQGGIKGENPFFGGPLSNITTNITGGGIGFFTAYAISEHQSVAE